MKRFTIILLFLSRFVMSQLPSLDWGHGNSFRAYFNNVDLDGKGALVHAAAFKGTMDADPGPLTYIITSAGPKNGYISKISPAGKLIWAKAYGGAGTLEFTSTTTDSIGNIYVTGSFSLAADLDPGPAQFPLSSTGWSSFVAKLDEHGFPLWCYVAEQVVHAAGTVQLDKMRAVSVDKKGNVSAAGEFFTVTDFDPSPVTQTIAAKGLADIFMVRLNPNGDLKWVRSIATNTSEIANAVLGGQNGNFYLLAGIRTTIDIDPGATTYTVGAPDQHFAIVCLDSLGTFSWGSMLEGSYSYGNAITGLPNGNVLVAGAFNGQTDFDPGPGTFSAVAASSDGFIWELTSSGTLVSVSVFQAQHQSNTFDVTTDLSGNIYACGLMLGTTDFDPGPGVYTLTVVNAAMPQGFICKLSPAGSLLWAGMIECVNYAYPFSIDVDREGNRIYSAGLYSDVLDLDPGPASYTVTSPWPMIPTSAGYVHSFCQGPPTAPIAISGNTTFCVGEYATFSITASAGAISYTWSVPGCVTGMSDSTSLQLNSHMACNGILTVQAINSCGTSAQQLNIEISECTRLDETTKTPLSVYPNPSTGDFFIDCPELEALNVRITDVQGRLIQEHRFSINSVRKISIRERGMYFCFASGNGLEKVLKLVVE